jgi:hypothetical protein
MLPLAVGGYTLKHVDMMAVNILNMRGVSKKDANW